ncbi:hypothetical protein GQ53DRAFT_463954 [Thozetella sp. PMI_491]|nr:hypothetical protein GQ53DRAFT_463954 [Thozetella sp. PMI_491]
MTVALVAMPLCLVCLETPPCSENAVVFRKSHKYASPDSFRCPSCWCHLACCRANLIVESACGSLPHALSGRMMLR